MTPTTSSSRILTVSRITWQKNERAVMRFRHLRHNHFRDKNRKRMRRAKQHRVRVNHRWPNVEELVEILGTPCQVERFTTPENAINKPTGEENRWKGSRSGAGAGEAGDLEGGEGVWGRGAMAGVDAREEGGGGHGETRRGARKVKRRTGEESRKQQ